MEQLQVYQSLGHNKILNINDKFLVKTKNKRSKNWKVLQQEVGRGR